MDCSDLSPGKDNPSDQAGHTSQLKVSFPPMQHLDLEVSSYLSGWSISWLNGERTQLAEPKRDSFNREPYCQVIPDKRAGLSGLSQGMKMLVLASGKSCRELLQSWSEQSKTA